MKLAGFWGCMLAIAPLGLGAQGVQSGGAMGKVTTTGSNGQTITLTLPIPNLCPVSMKASHGSDWTMVRTGPSHPKGIGQRLHLTLKSPDQRTIASATVNVRGWTAKGRMEEAQSGSDTSSPVRTLTVPFAADSDQSASADLWAPGLTSVTRVELVSVAFTDGTTWTPAQGKTCSVIPDPMMLVANH
jgi:hypothetical protein